MTAIKKRRLHVWEHPSLHPEEMKKHAVPVHVIFEDDEYDFWDINDGTLRIGLVFSVPPSEIPGYQNPSPYRKEVRYQISSGMYAKVWEEHYEEIPFVPEQTPLFDLEQPENPRPNDPDFVGRERFENQPYPAEGIDEPKDDHTIVMPAIKPDRIDEQTGVNLTHLASQINPSVPSLPAPPANDETRFDLHSPLLLMKTLEPADTKKDSE